MSKGEKCLDEGFIVLDHIGLWVCHIVEEGIKAVGFSGGNKIIKKILARASFNF